MDEHTYGAGAPPPVPPPPSRDSGAAEPLNPWFAIWVQPRATMRQILDSDPRRLVHTLAALGGAVKGFQFTVPPALADPAEPGAILGIKMAIAIVGAILSLAMLYLYGFLMRATGGWLAGRGDFTAVRSAIAWANVPTIWSALLLVPLVAFRGIAGLNFDPGTMMQEPGAAILLVPLVTLTVLITGWQIVVFLKCLGEAHAFSAWRALGAAFFAALILGAAVVIPIALVAFLVVGPLVS